MKLLKLTMGALLAVSLLTACGGKDKKEGDKKDTETKNGSAGKLDGSWVIRKAEGAMASYNIGTLYTFKGDRLTFGNGNITNPGTTVITDSTFSFQADGSGLKFMYNYKWNGDTLVVEIQGSSGQVFYMLKE